MKTNWITVLSVGVSSLSLVASAANPLTKASVTYAKNDVRYRPTGGDERPAKLTDKVQGSDVVRTGEKSVAELEFEDKTITRLGSNTIFSFKAGSRDMELNNGLILFHVPKGAGGAQIKTRAATAAITGTTGIIEAFSGEARNLGASGKPGKEGKRGAKGPPGNPGQGAGATAGLKVIILEGHARVLIQSNEQAGKVNAVVVRPGEMALVYNNGRWLRTPVDVKTMMNTSTFLKDAQKTIENLDTSEQIDQTVQEQQTQLDSGKLAPTTNYIAGTGDQVLTTTEGTDQAGTTAETTATTSGDTTLTTTTGTKEGTDGGTSGTDTTTTKDTSTTGTTGSDLTGGTIGAGQEANVNQNSAAFLDVGSTGLVRGQFVWNSEADMDLLVDLPGGGTVSFDNPTVLVNGGQGIAQLDNDNAGLPDAFDVSGKRVENFAVTGIPATGDYVFRVLNFNSYGSNSPTCGILTVTADGGQTIQQIERCLTDGQMSPTTKVTHAPPAAPLSR